ncbi:diguanylate cyclase [Pseudomonas eucalypticola]|uniref:diguanylate cyclase n=1 Tax=Pseudomonas eucalypticola TaxID=2599595 RepID=A0A7D5H2S3_9PSED|nr:diguanylate cyclase [Pseudomonas eucalypticola]QKZ06445.1 diguanylate cyclase [Pseudomonas eucalypticola]
MENGTGKGLSFAKRIYGPRVLGTALCLVSVVAGLYPLSPPAWLLGLLAFNGLVWPHIAYRLARRAAEPFQAERRNLLCDSLFCGFWVAVLHFNPLPTVTLLSMVTMNNVAGGGWRLFRHGLGAQLLGMLTAVTLFGLGWAPQSTPAQVWACLPMLILYPLAVGWVCYRLAIQLSEHKRTLSALSRTDSLTGLLNHGAWKDALNRKFRKCQHERSQAVLALIDIDRFKEINDTFGHMIGDEVLRYLSVQLRRNLRDTDLAGRYGGDEFCVILPGLSMAQACDVMERLRRVFGDYHHPHAHAMRVSLSIGLAACRLEMDDAGTWLGEADKALYVAKNTGRNRVSICVADNLLLN